MAVQLTSHELSQRYDRIARWYDRFEGILGLLGLSRFRRRVLQHARGKVLEVAVGTGKNLSYYPRDCRIIALDLSGEMLKVAQNRAAKLSMNVSFSLADAEALSFSAETFDTVVSSLSTCTFPDPVAALKEMARVCRPDGKILLLEHGRSDRQSLSRFQDRHADQFAKPLGCHWNREPLDMTRRAGLKIDTGIVTESLDLTVLLTYIQHCYGIPQMYSATAVARLLAVHSRPIGTGLQQFPSFVGISCF